MGDGRMGEIIRKARKTRGWTQTQLADELFCSRTQISRWEGNQPPHPDIATRQRLAAVLAIPPQDLGVVLPRAQQDGEAVFRREFLGHMAVAATATTAPQLAAPAAAARVLDPGLPLTNALQSCLLGPGPSPAGPVDLALLERAVAVAQRAFHTCDYTALAAGLPRLLAGAHAAAAGDSPAACSALARTYILMTRMAIKLDAVDLGLLAADRARTVASGSANPVLAGEAARNMAVVVRKAGRRDPAASLALDAADALTGSSAEERAQRGLLLMSAAYTAARGQDGGAEMGRLTKEASRIAADLGDRVVLPSHGGGFGSSLVELHLISGMTAAGRPDTALRIADQVNPAALPTPERRARYWSDVAAAAVALGKADRAVPALLAAEQAAPQEVRARPAVRALTRSILLSHRSDQRVRELAIRMGIAP